MKTISLFLGAAIILFCFSCGGSDEKKEATTDTTTTAAVETPSVAPEKPAFTPFKTFMVQHRVKDFTKWRAGYMGGDSMRKAYGMSHFRFGRGLEDSNLVYVIDIITDVQKAKELAASPELKNRMAKAGVSGPPKFSYAEVIRSDTSSVEPRDRVRVSHKVKDFDAWLKYYDSLGPQNRIEHGLADRAITRGIDDPNMVNVVFAVSDMAKAKARMNSEELKKIMKAAGVEGKPTIVYYRIVD